MDAASSESAITSCPKGEASDHRDAGAGGENEATMTDDELGRQVAAELSWTRRSTAR